MAVFRYSNPPEIFWGRGSLDQLHLLLEHHRMRRVLLMTTRSLLGNKMPVEPAATATIAQHAPLAQVNEAIAQAREAEVDGVVSFGGGSPIDAAKILALQLGGLPHVAIPTTLSAAELAAGAGFTDEAGTKGGMRDARLMPSAVIYDPEVTLGTPMELWLSTGIRALDHAVEGFLADGEHPFNDVMALEAVRRLFASLPKAKANPQDLEVRSANQLAAWFSFTLPGASASGLSHVMGKQFGARHRIPHGITSCLLLPHVMRYLAPSHPARMKELDAATGSDDAAGAVQRLIGELGLPQHIAEFGIGEPELRVAASELAGKHPEEDLLKIYIAAL